MMTVVFEDEPGRVFFPRYRAKKFPRLGIPNLDTSRVDRASAFQADLDPADVDLFRLIFLRVFRVVFLWVFRGRATPFDANVTIADCENPVAGWAEESRRGAGFKRIERKDRISGRDIPDDH